MAPTKKKEMFKPYDAAALPDSMPFPGLALVATTKGEEIPVPKLNKHQRSWILDVALRGINLQDVQTRAACTELYDKVKSDAFDAKAFHHVVQPGDAAEEAALAGQVTAWKLRNPSKKKAGNKSAPADNDASDIEEDEGAHVSILRGYPKVGWLLVSNDPTKLGPLSTSLINNTGNPKSGQ